MLNKIILMGRLTRDPELRRTESGMPMAAEKNMHWSWEMIYLAH